MKAPSTDTLLLEIDNLADLLTCPLQRRRLAILRAQLKQLLRDARIDRPQDGVARVAGNRSLAEVSG